MTDKDYEQRRIQQEYEIFDGDGNSINKIVADESFVKANFSSYKLLPYFRSPKKEIEWRNTQLKETDSLMLVSDYPHKEQLKAYRQALRDWPSTEDFPETRPVSFDEFLSQEQDV